jgi:uncharacterized membrane-anchored protein
MSDGTVAVNRNSTCVANFPTWLKARERAWLALGVAVQLAILAGMIVRHEMPYLTGQTVLLRVAPVDPRDMFRGDYVTLRYDFSRVPSGGIAGLGHFDYSRSAEWQNRIVYVSLVPEADGRHWRAERFSLERPTSGRYIRGTIAGWGRIECGIESYYVQEGTGHKYEEAVRHGRLSAEVAIAPNGRAALRGLRIEPASAPPVSSPSKTVIKK